MTSFFSGPIWIKFRRLVQNDMSTAVMCGYGNQMWNFNMALCFCLVGPSVSSSVSPVFRPVPNILLSIPKNTARISTKFAGGNYYHEQIK